jgi:hypothetical protein
MEVPPHGYGREISVSALAAEMEPLHIPGRRQPGVGRSGIPKTSSPTLKRFTPGTTSSTTPEMSHPRTNGGAPSMGKAPDLMNASIGFTPIARTQTTTSVGKAFGRSAVLTLSTSGPPNCDWVTTVIRCSAKLLSSKHQKLVFAAKEGQGAATV